MIIDLLPFFTPRLAVVFELAHEFLFLRVHADSWVAGATEFLTLFGDVPELLIALGMRLSGIAALCGGYADRTSGRAANGRPLIHISAFIKSTDPLRRWGRCSASQFSRASPIVRPLTDSNGASQRLP